MQKPQLRSFTQQHSIVFNVMEQPMNCLKLLHVTAWKSFCLKHSPPRAFSVATSSCQFGGASVRAAHSTFCELGPVEVAGMSLFSDSSVLTCFSKRWSWWTAVSFDISTAGCAAQYLLSRSSFERTKASASKPSDSCVDGSRSSAKQRKNDAKENCKASKASTISRNERWPCSRRMKSVLSGDLTSSTLGVALCTSRRRSATDMRATKYQKLT